MIINRRTFLHQSASVVALALLAQEAEAKGTLKKFGCQLYSIRDVMPKDPKGNMEALAKMGYKFFESYSKDPLWGMKAADAKKFFGDIGVQMISAHVGLAEITDELAAKAAEAGLNYLICPFIGPQNSMDKWKQKADEFNTKGELCKKHGLQFGYHNHSYSFVFASGLKGQKVLLDNTDSNLVCFELDMCWSEAAGENSIAHLKEYGKRYELCHIKQLSEKGDKPKQTDLDKGIIDYKTLLRAAKDNGMKYYLVEQEQYPTNPMESMASNAAYLKKLKF
jgi:sugar phosphate isomerase/epimerase